jgi:hypothetical protein
MGSLDKHQQATGALYQGTFYTAIACTFDQTIPNVRKTVDTQSQVNADGY